MAEAVFSSNTLLNATSVKLRLRALSIQKRICTAWVRQIEERVKITSQVGRPYLRNEKPICNASAGSYSISSVCEAKYR